MRITGGSLRGRKLPLQTNPQLRPTTDRAREALFSILQSRVHWPTATVLDLFAGTGSVGLECISRGAAAVKAVERHRGSAQALQKLVAEWRIENLTLRQQAVEAFLGGQTTPFALVFADPPYRYPGKESLVQRVQDGWLSAGGLLVLEHPANEAFDALPGFEQTRTYGQSAFSFFGLPTQTP